MARESSDVWLYRLIVAAQRDPSLLDLALKLALLLEEHRKDLEKRGR